MVDLFHISEGNILRDDPSSLFLKKMVTEQGLLLPCSYEDQENIKDKAQELIEKKAKIKVMITWLIMNMKYIQSTVFYVLPSN